MGMSSEGNFDNFPTYSITGIYKEVVIDVLIQCWTATKLAQAQKFNNPKDPCKVLVATDAIGMGINL